MKTAPLSGQIAACLREPLRVTHVHRHVFARGPATDDEIVTTSRLILVRKGRLNYTAEGRTIRIGEGTQFLVPAWTRRVWAVPASAACEIAWCEFDGEEPGGGLLRRVLPPADFRTEKAALEHLRNLFGATGGAWRELRLETEMKAMLARFLEKAVGGPERKPPPEWHPGVQAALRWAAEHFREPDVVATLYGTSTLSRNYLRTLFLRAMHCSPQAYVERIRLRQARHLLRHSNWQIKRIAAECGYPDPLYFSRLYRRWRGRSPTEERGWGPRREKARAKDGRCRRKNSGKA